MNVRVNILFFIETLCDLSLKAEYPEYVTLVQRDLKTIVSAVATESTEGAVNFEAVKKVRYHYVLHQMGAWMLMKF